MQSCRRCVSPITGPPLFSVADEASFTEMEKTLDSSTRITHPTSVAQSNTGPPSVALGTNDVVGLSDGSEDTISEGCSGKPSQNKKRKKGAATQDSSKVHKKERERTSEVWKYMEGLGENPIIKKKSAKCNLCKAVFSLGDSSSTSSLIRHLKKCKIKHGIFVQTCLTLEKGGKNYDSCSVTNFKYDQQKMRDIIAQYILVDELPFRHVESFMFNKVLSTASPHWKPICRATVRSDIMKFYKEQKDELKLLFKTVDRINITTDMWTSDAQRIGYMVVTAHWVDSNWKLNKRIINFFNVPPPHTGFVISESLNKCFQDWGIFEKIGTISVDNARANDVAIRELKKEMLKKCKKSLLLGGELFHVRCSAHILNLLVQDGLSVIGSIVDRVREGVKYLVASEGRRLMFAEYAKNYSIAERKLILDCPTRWNACYNMLKTTIIFKDVFTKYGQNESIFSQYAPSEEEWSLVEVICSFLEKFNNASKIISGSDYPTSNLFLGEVFRVRVQIDLHLQHDDHDIKEMAQKMKDKFDKYWSETNLVMTIGACLDPRFKMKMVKYCFEKIYGKTNTKLEPFKNSLAKLFQEYVEADDALRGKSKETLSGSNSGHKQYGDGDEAEEIARIFEFEEFGGDSDGEESLTTQSELDLYLAETRWSYKEQGHFDCLEWWKVNSPKYPILSKMARDILAIPVTTVASESTFSAGGRVIEPHRACLKPETVQALLCGGDWARELNGLKGAKKGKEKVELKEVEIDLYDNSSMCSGATEDCQS